MGERSGHDDALAALYNGSVREVYRYALRLTGGDTVRADDLVQDAFVDVYRQLRRGDAEVSTGYVIVACRNRFLGDLRSARRRRGRETRAMAAVGVGNDPADAADRSATDAMGALPDDQRAALVLRYVDDLPVAEVAALLGRSVHATESLLARGRATLRARLGGAPS